ncbi:hypothetical protein Pint_11474 [Pistacia integerrima]|uniref:Uncharacterized protein n=1 Tax=Pistacia integerrima TaxID=434235 RepID=A0ACC0XMC0_9ROSI|nr:hypothetical protein Pint_11474 [Pistacia integerrima]
MQPQELKLSGVDLKKTSQTTKWAEPLIYLSNLQKLELSNCRIFGKLPAKQLLNLTSLSGLVMDFNSLSSPIPREFVNLTSLSELDFTNSNIQGPIPYLPQLKKLFVRNNSEVTIDLHSMFAAPWPKLEILDISSTLVNGSLPSSLANTTSLRHFQAWNCLLQGPIPASFMNLSKLETLSLAFNNITGRLSPLISNLRCLNTLNMMQNSLEGTIPTSICNMTSLEYLSLSDNFLTGNLPGCISQLSRLEFFLISQNKMNGTIRSLSSLFKNANPIMIMMRDSGLTVKEDQPLLPPNFRPQFLDLSVCLSGGTIPDFISSMTQLVMLSLAYNNLSGTIPPWLFNLPNLGYLDLSFNNLQGVVPPHIKLQSFMAPTTLNLANNQLKGNIPSLIKNVEVIDLSGNSFTGHIPLQLGVAKIKYLSLSGNKLYSQIPLPFCHSGNVLMLLDLSNNSLRGTVPKSLGNCTSLIFLNLGGNNLIGEIPSELEGAKNLSYLDLTDNLFNGSFPGFIQKFQSLEVLKLGFNRFQGRIPQFIGALQNLHILVLESNFFNGSIPWEITKLEKLQYVDFSSNKLSGPIPENLNGLKMLKTRPQDGSILGFVISSMFAAVELTVTMKGLLQHYVIVRSYHSGIDLSYNCLTGNIPIEIGTLEGLPMVNLSHNCLYGEIPKSIGNMSVLESLDLSFNNLSGEIPAEITLLDYLSLLNLSYNNLSGKIPSGQQFETLTIDGSAYIGNELLCGDPLRISCTGKSNSSTSESVEVEDAWWEKLFYAVVIFGYGVGFWGFFGILYLMKDNWRNIYWMTIDRIAFGIIQSMRKQD